MMNPKDEISNTAKNVDINKVKLELRHIRDRVNILLDSLDSKGPQVTSSTEESTTSNAAQPEKVHNGIYNAVNPKEFDPLQQKSQEKVDPKQEIGKTPPPENPASGESAAAEIKPPASMVNTMGSNPAGVSTAVSNPNIPRSTPQGEYYMSNSTGEFYLV